MNTNPTTHTVHGLIILAVKTDCVLITNLSVMRMIIANKSQNNGLRAIPVNFALFLKVEFDGQLSPS